MYYGRLPFQLKGNMPRHVYLKTVKDKAALAAYAAAIAPYTSASIEHGELSEMFDIDIPEKAGGAYSSVKFLVVVHMHDKDGVRYSTAIPAPLESNFEIKRQMYALKDEPGKIITQAYSALTGLDGLTFDQGALVG